MRRTPCHTASGAANGSSRPSNIVWSSPLSHSDSSSSTVGGRKRILSTNIRFDCIQVWPISAQIMPARVISCQVAPGSGPVARQGVSYHGPWPGPRCVGHGCSSRCFNSPASTGNGSQFCLGGTGEGAGRMVGVVEIDDNAAVRVRHHARPADGGPSPTPSPPKPSPSSAPPPSPLGGVFGRAGPAPPPAPANSGERNPPHRPSHRPALAPPDGATCPPASRPGPGLRGRDGPIDCPRHLARGQSLAAECRARRRPGGRRHFRGRTLRTGPAPRRGPGGPRRSRPLRPRQRPLPRLPSHRRRPAHRPLRPFHGHPLRRQPRPHPQGPSPTALGPRQETPRHPHRLSPQALRLPQPPPQPPPQKSRLPTCWPTPLLQDVVATTQAAVRTPRGFGVHQPSAAWVGACDRDPPPAVSEAGPAGESDRGSPRTTTLARRRKVSSARRRAGDTDPKTV